MLTATSCPVPLDALELLKAGNARFVAGRPECGPYGPRVAQFADDPFPFAVILGCSDARLPIEAIFDQVPGNLFIVRVAGNFLNDDNLASIEYAVDILGASLILVLGHSRCGAVIAASNFVKTGVSPHGHMPHIINKLVPSIEATRGLPGDWVDNATAHNVARNVDSILGASGIVANALDAGKILVAGGIYDVVTGEVTFR